MFFFKTQTMYNSLFWYKTFFYSHHFMYYIYKVVIVNHLYVLQLITNLEFDL